MKTHRFTLIELLVVMVIAVVLMAVATPSIIRAVSDEQFSTSARYVSRVIMLARQEAITKRKRVAVLFPSDGNLIATCYVHKITGAFDGWTPGQATVWLKTIGLVEGLYVVPESGPPMLATSQVSGISWSITPSPSATCPAIVFKPTGTVDSGSGLAPYAVKIIDAVRAEDGTAVVRSTRDFNILVNCFTGHYKFVTSL